VSLHTNKFELMSMLGVIILALCISITLYFITMKLWNIDWAVFIPVSIPVTGILHDGIYLSTNPSATGSGATNGSNGSSSGAGSNGNANGSNGNANGSSTGAGSNGNTNLATWSSSQYTVVRDGTSLTVRPFGGTYYDYARALVIQYDYSAVKIHPDGTVDTFMYKRDHFSATGSTDTQVAAVRCNPTTGVNTNLNDRLL